MEDALGLVPAQPVPGAAHGGGVARAGAGTWHRAADGDIIYLMVFILKNSVEMSSSSTLHRPPVSAGIVTVVELRIPGGCHSLLHQKTDTG